MQASTFPCFKTDRLSEMGQNTDTSTASSSGSDQDSPPCPQEQSHTIQEQQAPEEPVQHQRFWVRVQMLGTMQQNGPPPGAELAADRGYRPPRAYLDVGIIQVAGKLGNGTFGTVRFHLMSLRLPVQK